jgi:hypothetical protein
MSGFKKWILILAWGLTFGLGLSCHLHAAEPIVIAQENRVPNRTDNGVCWWAAAETIGKQYGIKSLLGLTEAVVKDGRGWKDGANDITIPLWLNATKTKHSRNPHGKTTEGAKWIAEQLAAGKPVVSCQNVIGKDGRTYLHAFLITKFDYDTQKVHYIDCNDVTKDFTKDYTDWYSWWYGRAFSFDLPAPGEAAVQPKADPKAVAPAPKGVPLGQGHIPIEHPFVGPEKPYVFPSNQDIKDGIQRPDDTLRYGIFKHLGGGVGGSYDYYSEFKGGKKK